MRLKSFQTHHLVKSADLNHHGTLFAGRGASWFVESGLLAAANVLDPKHIICKMVHGMHFEFPAQLGDIICYHSKVVYTGRTSLTVSVRAYLDLVPDKPILDGFITFVYVDENTRPQPHNVFVEPESEEDRELYLKAEALKQQM